MGFPISSCLNQFHPLPTTSSSSSITKSSSSNSTQLGWSQQEERSWKTQRILGIGCSVIIGIEMASFLIADHQSIAMGLEQQQVQVQVQVELKSKAGRWSDKRSCLPWHFNSLETIVPENLPRLSSRRKWQSIDSSEKHHAPSDEAVIKVANQSKKCFSL